MAKKEAQERLLPIEVLESWSLPSDFPGNVADLVKGFIERAINQRVERRGYGIFISNNTFEEFAEKQGQTYLEHHLGVDPVRYGEELLKIVGVVDQEMQGLTRIKPQALDEWKAGNNF